MTIAIINTCPLNDSATRKIALKVRGLLRSKNITCPFFDGRENEIPVFNGDSYQHNNPDVKFLSDVFKQNDLFLIFTPEKNKTMNAVFKNVIEFLHNNDLERKKVALYITTNSEQSGIIASKHIKETLFHMGFDIVLDYVIFNKEGEQHVLNELSKIQKK